MKNELILFATGDVGVNRPDPSSMFAHVRDTLNTGNFVFGQLEPNMATVGTPASQSRLPMRGNPGAAASIRDAGYDVISFASNHCMDYGPDAFFQTIDNLEGAGIRALGVGTNLAEARKPVILEAEGVKVGFLGYNSILPQDYWATDERPGCAPMRGLTVYEPIEHDQPGTPCRIHTFPHKADMEMMLEDIANLRGKVDVLAVSFHWGIHFIPAVLADYQRCAAYAAIDAGADIILGHHTHILKPIEVYKGKVILYSMANFALEAPHAFDEHLEEKASHRHMKSLNGEWGKSETKMPPDSYKSLLFRAIIRDKRIDEVSFLPVQIDQGNIPRIVKNGEAEFDGIVEYMRAISANQGIETAYTVKGDIVYIG